MPYHGVACQWRQQALWSAAIMSRFEYKRYREGSRGDGRDLRPLEVVVDDGNVDRALKILKRKMADEGILRELKKRRFYEKPSEKKKRKQREAQRRRRKAERRLRTPRPKL
jgi:small subunit ribosomal protein S21